MRLPKKNRIPKQVHHWGSRLGFETLVRIDEGEYHCFFLKPHYCISFTVIGSESWVTSSNKNPNSCRELVQSQKVQIPTNFNQFRNIVRLVESPLLLKQLKEYLNQCDRYELRSRTFGDREISWWLGDEKVAEAYEGRTVVFDLPPQFKNVLLGTIDQMDCLLLGKLKSLSYND